VDTRQRWVIPALSATATLNNEGGRTIDLHIQATPTSNADTCSLKIDANLRNLPGPDGLAVIKGKFAAVPLGWSNLLLRRIPSATRVDGMLSGAGEIVAEVRAGTPHVEMTGDLAIAHVFLKSPHLAEVLQLDRIVAPYSLCLDDQTLSVRRAEVECDLGSAS